MNRLLRAMPRRSWPIAVAVAMFLGVGAASAGAGAASEIEGVWSFNGGQIGIQRLSNGTFAGTVVVETKFAECTHPVGQEIWRGMTEQPDGSYWGLHQWYRGAPACETNPVLGPTAWRVLREPNGSHYLRVCFSHPGTSQPTIAADGAPKRASEYAQYHVTYGCFNSALTAPLPVAPGSGKGGSGKGGSSATGSVEHLTLPSAKPKQCLSARLFKIRLRDPRYDPFKTVTITLKGHRIATSRRGDYVVATINLSGLSTGTFTIKIRATTVLGHHLSTSRTYHTCIKKVKPKKPSKKEKRGKKG
jgi:hypothetical protein